MLQSGQDIFRLSVLDHCILLQCVAESDISKLFENSFEIHEYWTFIVLQRNVLDIEKSKKLVPSLQNVIINFNVFASCF